MRAPRAKAVFFAAGLLAGAGASAYAGCMMTTTVPGTQPTVMAAIAATPVVWSGDLCVTINANYNPNENIDVAGAGKNQAGYRVVITGGVPTPLLGVVGANAAFAIHSPSVTIQNVMIDAVVTGAMYGIVASSDAVQISSVVIFEGGNVWSNGAAAINANYAQISNSSFTAGGVPALKLTGAYNVVTQSTMTTGLTGSYGLLLSGAAYNSIVQSYVRNNLSTAAFLVGNSSYNTIMQSTMSAGSALANQIGGNGLTINGGSFNTILYSVLAGGGGGVGGGANGFAGGHGLFILGGSTNTIAFTHMIGGGGGTGSTGGPGLEGMAGGDGGNNSPGGSIGGSGGHGLFINASSSNTIIRSTMDGGGAGAENGCAATGAGGDGLHVVTGSSNSVTQSFMRAGGGGGGGSATTTGGKGGANGGGAGAPAGGFCAPNGGTGASLQGASIFDTISQSTMTGGGSAPGSTSGVDGPGLSVTQSASEGIFGSYAQSAFASGAVVATSTNTTISGSTLTSTGSTALVVNASSATAAILSLMSSAGGYAAYLQNGTQFTLFDRSTMTTTAAGFDAVSMNTNVSSTTISRSYVQATANNSSGVSIYNGSYNVVDKSTITNQSTPGGMAGYFCSSSACAYNTISNSLVLNGGAAGIAIAFYNQANNNTVILTTAVRNGAGGNATLTIFNSSTNTITQSYFSNTGSFAGGLVGASSNTISFSTFSAAAGLGSALQLNNNSSSNTITNVSLYAPASTGLDILSGNYNMVRQSLIASNSGGGYAASLSNGGAGASYNTITQSFLSNSAGIAVNMQSNSNGNTISLSTVTSGSANPALYATLTSSNTISQSYIYSSLWDGIALDVGTSSTTISLSTVATGGAGPIGGIYINQAASNMISGSVVWGSTAVVVNNSANTTIAASVLTATGGGQGLLIQNGSGLVSVGGSTIASTGYGAAVAVLAPGPLQAIGPMSVRGDMQLIGGAFQAGNFVHLLGGDLISPNPTGLTAQSSTITFDGSNDVPARTYQMVNTGAGLAFNGLAVNVSSIQFVTRINAGVFTDNFAGSTATFAAGGLPTIITDLEIHGGGALSGFVNLRSSVGGSPWNLNLVSLSSVTRASVSDSNAGFGTRVDANDLMSVDGGGNNNWNFLPFLAITLPGQVYTGGVGNVGAPSGQVAGVPFTATVYAVSSSSRVLNAAFPVTLNTADPHGFPSNAAGLTQTLVAGATNFNVTLFTAEPSPLATLLTASPQLGGSAFGQGFNTVNNSPNAYTSLQTLMPGETTDPGGPTGKGPNPPDVQVMNVPIPAVTVREVDQYFNLESAAPSHPMLILGTSASSSSWPSGAQGTAGGFTTLVTTVTVYSTGTFVTVTSSDNVGGVANGVSSAFQVVPPSFSTPTVSLNFASATVASIGGALSGAAVDVSAVNKVLVGVKDTFNGLFYNSWPAPGGTFTSPTVVYGTATRTGAVNNPNWSIALPDTKLTNGHTYLVAMVVINASGLNNTLISSFTFSTAGLAFGGNSGQGTVSALLPAISSGCEPAVESLTFTVGAGGINPGGAVAVRLPDGWQVPSATATLIPAPLLGQVGENSSNGAVVTSLTLNPVSYSTVTLGAGWVLLTVKPGPAFVSGDTINFSFNTLPPLGSRGRGPQSFSVMSAGDSASPLLPIASQPAPMTLSPGTSNFIAFTDYSPFSVGPLQTGATMQLQLTDLCGNPKVAGPVVTASLTGVAPTGAGPVTDNTAVFYLAGGGGPTGNVSIPPGATLSSGFYLTTSTTGVTAEIVRATASLPSPGNPAFVGEADRPFTILASSLTFSNVSIDTGSVIPGNKTSVLAPGATGFVTVRFSASVSGLPWNLVISTDPVNFSAPVFSAGGLSDAAHPQNVTWNGVNNQVSPAQFVPPGNYYVRIMSAQVQDASLQVQIPASAFIYGNLGALGAGAAVAALGPGAGYGNAALASATGYFQLFGLVNGNSYDVAFSTALIFLGQSVNLSTTVFGVVAANAGTLIPGTIAFPSVGLLRVHVTLPTVAALPAPHAVTGRVSVHNANYTSTAVGTLHFAAGSVSSDNGAQDFGQTASTLTVLALTPDTYAMDISVPELHLSTTVTGVGIAAATIVDQILTLPHKANVAGFAVLPSTTPFGSAVSVEAVQLGSLLPTVFGGTFVPPDSPLHLTTAPYALYGLDPGSWTIIAKSPGFTSASQAVLISTADVGDLTTGLNGLNLSLGGGGVIIATVTVTGDTTKISQCFGNCVPGYFDLPLQAYNAQTFTNTNLQVRLAQSSTLTQSTVSISGLDSGVYTLRAFLNGFAMTAAGGQQVALSTPAVAIGSVTLAANNARLQVQINIPPLPGGVCHSSGDFRSVGLLAAPPQSSPRIFADITAYTTTFLSAFPPTYGNVVDGGAETYYCSSMTLLSPPSGTGYGVLGLMYGPTGGFAQQSVPLANNATATLLLDVSMATFTVSGRVSLSGGLGLPGAGGLTVAVSSVAGVLLNTPTTGYCLLSSSNPIAVSAFHLELVPVDPHQSGNPLPFLMTGPGALGSCSAPAYAPTGGALGYSPIGYIASINPDGTYQFSGVPAGGYTLRNNPFLDFNPANGAELAPLNQTVRVTSNTVIPDLRLGTGSKVSGTVLLPGGVTASFPVGVILEDSNGQPLRSLNVGFANSNAASFLFDVVPDGRYAIQAVDLRSPGVFVAAPLPVTVSGASVLGQTIRMVFGGTIKATVAVRQALAGGATQFVLITPNNANLLPPSFGAVAVASPWFVGGFSAAQGTSCPGGNCSGIALDPGGKIVFSGLLPGTYDVEFLARPGQASLQDSGVSLVTTVKSSVRVSGGQTTDIGVVQLIGGVGLGGVVSDAGTGLPVSNVRLQARPAVSLPGQIDGRNGLPQAFTDQQGRYFFSGLDPTIRFYDVFAGVRLGEHQGDINPAYEQKIARAVDLQSTSTLNFSMIPAPYSVSGQVLPRNGEALRSGLGQGQAVGPGAAIFLQKANVVPTANPVADIVFITDAYGNFVIPNLTPGTYRMAITALGYLTNNLVVSITSGSVGLGQIQLDWGSTMQGSIRKPDGSAPSEDEISAIVAAAPDMTDFFFGMATRDPFTRSITGYQLSGFKIGQHYRLLFLSSDQQQLVSPSEASDIVFTSSQEVRNVDVVFRPSRPFVVAKDRRAGASFAVVFQLSQPLRAKTAGDDNLSAILTTASAQGTLSSIYLADNRRTLQATYTPGVSESSFTLHLKGYTSIRDPDSIDAVNPEFVVDSTASFFVGIDGAHKANINNLSGGALVVEGDAARVTLPKGAFGVDASSAVNVLLQKFSANVNTGGQQGTLGVAAANVRSLPFQASAYPSHMIQAVAALPATVSPFSGFYDVLLPLGLRTALSKPTPMTITYSTGVDPTTLNLYWYNAAANAYILQQDVTGSPPVIDPINHTITVNVNHFSTFVLFNTGVEVITGNAFPGTDIAAYSFPNPFGLNNKQVFAIHGGSCAAGAGCTVRGTMISIAVPPGISGDGTIRIYNVAGERVRQIDLGSVSGGNYLYQEWDGRNNVGRDVASGVYIGQIKIGDRTKFFKMALIK